MIYGPWESLNVCDACHVSTGRYLIALCPHCGVSNEFYIPVKKVIYRTVTTYEYRPNPKWWQFWKKEIKFKVVTYEGKDDFSKKWVNEHYNKKQR